MKITTIIPFFNSGSAISTMLDSILHGTILPYEILMIDDGSSDESPSIVQDYAARFPFIKYIKKEHAGVSAARNLGIQMATGDCINFLDADDYIDRHMYEQLANSLDDSVAGCLCGYFTEKDGISTEYVSSYHNLSSQELLKAMFTDDNVRGFLFTRIFRADIVKKLQFNTSISMCEDLLFQTTLLTSNPELKFAYVKAPLYHYVQNSNSATSKLNFFDNNIFKYKPAFEAIRKLAKDSYIEDSYNSILEYSMYRLLKAYKTGDKQTIPQIRLLQEELKSTNPENCSKRRLAYIYAPILYSHILK